MTRICLYCQNEYSDDKDQCPECYGRLYRQKVSPKKGSPKKASRRKFGRKIYKTFIDYGKFLLGITAVIAFFLILVAGVFYFGGMALQNIVDSSPSSNNPNIAPNPNIVQSKSLNNPISISALYITENDLSKLNTKYSTDNLEFRYCLFGESYKNGVLITNMIEPEYQSRTQTSLFATECPSTSIGFVHSHPGKDGCILSQGDITTLNSEHFTIQGVICDKNRITIFTKDNPKNFIPIYAVSTNSNNVIYSRDITPLTACVGERFCNGNCWSGCGSHDIFHCTVNGGQCDPDPNNCPSGTYSCIGKCYDGCSPGGVWSCTPQGGLCQFYN